MGNLRAFGTLLASAPGDTALRYLLLPFGEPGRTSAGTVTASAGTLQLPGTPMVANLEHDPTRPIGWMTAAETPQGLTAEVTPAQTTAGADAVVEARSGLRTGISVEIADPVIRGGALLGGRLTGAGLVATPAFASAQLVAADAGDLPPQETTAEQTPADQETTEDEPASDDAPQGAESEGDMPEAIAAAAPVGAPVGGMQLTGSALTASELTAETAFRMFATAHATANPQVLLAALSNITQAGVFDVVNQPEFIGHVWQGLSYQPKYAPLIGSGTLSSTKVSGWRFKETEKPVVGDYTPLAQPASANVSTEAVEITASRLAGAWNVDRIHFDLGSAEFWQAFFAAAADDIARKLDAKVLASLVLAANSTAVTTSLASIPSGVSQAAAQIVDGALAIGDYGTPSFALVPTALFRALTLTKANDALEYLNTSLSGLTDGQLANFKFLHAPTLAAGTVVVGCREAQTLYTLPGQPIRVDAQAIATGSVNEAVFAYYAILPVAPKGISVVTTVA